MRPRPIYMLRIWIENLTVFTKVDYEKQNIMFSFAFCESKKSLTIMVLDK